MPRTKKEESLNSFYRFGGIEMLEFTQDEKSLLWKIRFSTPEHYVVSREFDKTKGLFADFPTEVIRRGLMEFSDNLYGPELSIFDVMDLYIDGYFDERMVAPDTQYAVWMSYDPPTLDEISEIYATYSSRLKWFDLSTAVGSALHDVIFKDNLGSNGSALVASLAKGLKDAGITAMFMNPDKRMEKIVRSEAFADIPLFMAKFSTDGQDFREFSYVNRG